MHCSQCLFPIRSQTNSLANCSATISVEESLNPRHGGNYAKLWGIRDPYCRQPTARQPSPRQCSALGFMSNKLSTTYPKMTRYTALAHWSLMVPRSHKVLPELPFFLHN